MEVLIKLFFAFFKIGLFTFGGGYAMIPLIQEEVTKNGWLTAEEVIDIVGIAESTPGPIAVNLATFVGTSQMGFLGALVATLGVILPSFIIILLIAIIFKKIMDNKYVKSILKGINPVIIGLILATGLFTLFKILVPKFVINENFAFSFDDFIRPLIICLILTLIMFLHKKIRKKTISAIMLLVISICLGIVVYAI